MDLIKIIDLSTLEKKIYHYHLWKWCADNHKIKSDWPGWKIIEANYSSCFLCHGNLAEHCTECKIPDETDCLNGLFNTYLKSATLIEQQPNNVSYQANFTKICHQIANLRFKNQSEWFTNTSSNLKTIVRIKRQLSGLYGTEGWLTRCESEMKRDELRMHSPLKKVYNITKGTK